MYETCEELLTVAPTSGTEKLNILDEVTAMVAHCRQQIAEAQAEEEEEDEEDDDDDEEDVEVDEEDEDVVGDEEMLPTKRGRF